MPASEFGKAGGLASPKNDKLSHIKEENEPDLVAEFKNKRSFEQKQPQFSKQIPTAPSKPAAQNAKPVQAEISGAKNQPLQSAPQTGVSITDKKPPKPLRLLGEAFKTYIICEYDGKICIIDKHAAHERILFNKLKANQEAIIGQTLLTPIPVRLNPKAAAEVMNHADMMESLGFSLEEFGENTLLLRQIPMDLSSDDAAGTVETLAEDLLRGRVTEADTVRDEMLHTVACKAAIKAGWVNDEKELMAVAKAVMSDETLKYCPHGRPVCVTLSKKNLERQFKRT